MTRHEKMALLCILLVAAILRLWNFPSYYPHFWDEAKYLAEIEGIMPYFSVNAGSFTFLQLGYRIFGLPSYPQLIAAIFGLLVVLGLYLVGRRVYQEKRQGSLLGLVMAGLGAVMPYFVIYSRHALATIFALCFFVYSLYFYLGKLQRPRVKNARGQQKYLRYAAIPAVLLAMVSACSFKFLLPTAISFVLLEIFIWRVRQKQKKEFRSGWSLLFSLLGGAVLFAVMPPILAAVSGYEGWLERAIVISRFHGEIKTLRLAGHFLYPLHLYYLAGPLFIICALGGAVMLLSKWKPKKFAIGRSSAGMMLAIGFVVYFLFFGLLSHLQSARLYALTLPFVVFVAAVFLCGLRHLFTRYGRQFFIAGCALILASGGYGSIDFLTKSANLSEACRVAIDRVGSEKSIYTNAKAQVAYGSFKAREAANKTTATLNISSFVVLAELAIKPDNPPIVMLQDGVDLVSTIANYDKRDDLRPLDSMQLRVNDYHKVAAVSDLLYVGRGDFFTSPYYYLEDIYSWRGYAYIRELLPQASDSIYVYLIDPARTVTPLRLH